MSKHNSHIETLHSMESFGKVDDLLNKIRCSRLEERMVPVVPFPHKHNFHFLMYIIDGSGWHEIDFRRYPVKKGAIYFMNPAQIHSWELSKNAKGIIVEFEDTHLFKRNQMGVEFKDLLKNIPEFVQLQNNEIQHFSFFIEHILEEYLDQNKNFELALKSYLQSIIIFLSRYSSDTEVEKNLLNPLLKNFMELLEHHYQTEHDPNFYSKKMGLKTKSLSEKIKRITGKSLRNIILERCILEGKRLLAYSNLSISEIAIEVGFNDPNYFARLFKNKMQLSPGDFRKKSKHCC